MTRQRILTGAIAAAFLAVSCFSERTPLEQAGDTDCRLPLDRVARGDALVLIRGQQFLPDTVHVRPGQAVTWVNCEVPGGDPHTSTAQGGAWDSPLLRSGDYFSHQLTASGSFAYTCLPHPHMRGVVIAD